MGHDDGEDLVAASRRRLEAARAAAARLRRRDADARALHRFRVSLRRLSVLLDAFDAELCAPRAALRTMRATLKATGPARDRQVFRRWLDAAPRTRRAVLAAERAPGPWLWPRFDAAAERLAGAL
ncbi:MAG: CHAD domain-containing protein, partial [Elusimicrobiota bacterium]|nr:CHAD domain-containing protein [Elusimicrobiota bacterium]